MAYDNNTSDFVSTNLSTDVPSDGGNGLYPVWWEFLRDFIIWDRRLQITLAIITVLFTAFVMVVIAKEKSFHNTTNYFVTNLMASDFVRGIGQLIYVLFGPDTFSCGGLIMYLQHVMFQVSCCTLILLTLTRYDAILNPLRSINRWNGRRVLTVSIMSWLASFIIQIPSYFLVCFPGTTWALANHIYIYTIMFLIPSIILIFCYSRITFRVLGNAFRNKQLSVAKQQDTPGLRAAFQKKLTRMVVTILVVFFLLRAPRSTFVLYKFMTSWRSVHWIRDRIVLRIVLLMNQLNGAVDPFIYALCAPQFREYLAAKLNCCRRKQKEGSQSLPSVMTHITQSPP